MTKNSIYSSADKLNPLFQQPQGKAQERDHAFFTRKYGFMHQQQLPQAKTKSIGNYSDNRN